MRGTDEGDEHLNMKDAVCDLLSPQAVHLQGIDPITQKQAIQTGNKTSNPGSLLRSDIQASCSNHGSLYLPRDLPVWKAHMMLQYKGPTCYRDISLCQTCYKTQDPFICTLRLRGSVFICAHMQVCVLFVIRIEKLHLATLQAAARFISSLQL